MESESSNSSGDLMSIIHSVVFVSDSSESPTNVDSSNIPPAIEPSLDVEVEIQSSSTSDTSFDPRSIQPGLPRTSSSSCSINEGSSNSCETLDIYVQLDEPLVNLSPGLDEIFVGEHHQLAWSDDIEPCRVCDSYSRMNYTHYICPTCRVHICSRNHLRLWHNQRGNPERQPPPVSSRTRSQYAIYKEGRPPVHGFTSDEERLLQPEGGPSNSQQGRSETGPDEERLLQPEGVPSTSQQGRSETEPSTSQQGTSVPRRRHVNYSESSSDSSSQQAGQETHRPLKRKKKQL